MILNVPLFQLFLKKATLDYYINSVSIEVTPKTFISKMVSKDGDAVSILKTENNIISECKSDFTLNFFEPSIQLKPFLDLIEDDEVILDVKDDGIKLSSGKLRSKVSFCKSQVLTIFGADKPRLTDFFCTIPINEALKEHFPKIRKIVAKFGYDVYFTVKDNVLSIETLDIENPSSNVLSFELQEAPKITDRTVRFSIKTLSKMMKILEDDSDFVIDLAYFEAKKAGALYCHNEMKSEQYILAGVQKAKK